MSLPSGPRAIATSTVTFSRPMIRSIHSPLNTPGLPQSNPSSARNRTVSSRSSTTRPTWTKSVTPGRWLLIEVKRLGRDRGAAEVVRLPPRLALPTQGITAIGPLGLAVPVVELGLRLEHCLIALRLRPDPDLPAVRIVDDRER